MPLTVAYTARDLTTAITPKRPHTVTGLSWDAFGGCQTATIESYGGAAEMATLYNYLRYGVMIYDEYGRKVWWGYVNAVYVTDGPIQIGLSIDDMANTVQVVYSYVQPGTNEVGTRKITTAITNADSIAEFGTKQIVLSQGGMTDTSAADMATRYLASNGFPMGTAAVQGTGRAYGYFPAQRGTFASVRIECKGWMSTLSWRYANVSMVGISHDIGGSNVAMGSLVTNAQRGQQFTVGTTALYTVGATFSIKKTGSPADTIYYEIYALDGSGYPTGSALASASMSGASLTTTLTLMRLTFSTPYTLAANTQYGLVFRRSGAVDSSNYYNIEYAAAAGYSGGGVLTYNSSTPAWSSSTASDYRFRVEINPLMETTQQIKDLETTYGEFITYTDIVTASGVSTPSNRDGDVSVLDIMRELAGFGGPNDRRLLLTVTPERVLMVEEEEAQTAYAYYIDTSGRIITTGETVLPPYMPPVGRWIKIKDFIPGAGNPIYLANATIQFLEGADWSIGGGLTPRFRGQPDIADLATLAGSGGY